MNNNNNNINNYNSILIPPPPNKSCSRQPLSHYTSLSLSLSAPSISPIPSQNPDLPNCAPTTKGLPSTHPPIYLSIHLPIHASIYLSTHPIHASPYTQVTLPPSHPHLPLNSPHLPLHQIHIHIRKHKYKYKHMHAYPLSGKKTLSLLNRILITMYTRLLYSTTPPLSRVSYLAPTTNSKKLRNKSLFLCRARERCI